jgi:hypothetical protein
MHTRAGWPDLTAWPNTGPIDLASNSPRLVIAELKTETAHVKRDRRETLLELAAMGAPTCSWRPSDVDEIVAVLSGEA